MGEAEGDCSPSLLGGTLGEGFVHLGLDRGDDFLVGSAGAQAELFSRDASGIEATTLHATGFQRDGALEDGKAEEGDGLGGVSDDRHGWLSVMGVGL